MRVRSVLVSSLLTLLSADAVRAQPAETLQCKRAESVTAFGRTFQPAMLVDAEIWSQPVPISLTGFTVHSIRLLFAVTPDASDRNWTLVVRDSELRLLASFGPHDFADDQGRLTRRRWTGRLPSASARVELLAAANSDVKIKVLEGVASPDTGESDARLFSLQTEGAPSWKPLYENSGSEQRRSGDVVGMLVTGSTAPPGAPSGLTWCCSGVLMSRELFLTNWHCGAAPGAADADYWTRDIRDRSLVEMAWDDGKISRQYGVVEVVAKDKQLDYALLRIEPVVGPGGVSGSAGRATIAADDVAAKAEIFVVHHAKCEKKLISRQCRVASASYPAWWSDPSAAPSTPPVADKPDFTHDCDTEPGASGAPVFAVRGGKAVLFGMHHMGFDRDAECKAILPKLNKAVRIGEILKHLERERPGVTREFAFE